MKTVAALAAMTALANAHATFQQLWKNGKDLESTCARLPPSNSPVEDYTSNALQCNVSPAPADGKCDFEAGDTVTIEMHQHNSRDCTEEGIGGAHWGPVLAYMSKVEDAATADGSSEFFKVYQNTWAKNPDAAQGDGDFWGTKDLNYNCGKLDFTIPKNIAPGDYLLRAEAIALHAAGPAGGAQHYMTCYQLTVTGSGTLEPKGVTFPEAYSKDGPGLGFSIHADLESYPAPGPELIAGGTEATPQLLTFGKISGAPAATATGGAETPVASTAASVAASSTPAPASSSAVAEAESSSAAPVEVSSTVESSAVETPSPIATSAAPVESEAAPTSAPVLSSVVAPYPVANSTSFVLPGTASPIVSSSVVVAPTTMMTAVRPSTTPEATGPIKEYYQCGGQNYKGTSECAEGLVCKHWNPWYFQCVKPEATKPGPSKGPMPTSSAVASKPTATAEAPKPTAEAPKPTYEASKPSASAQEVKPTAEPTSVAPVAVEPSQPAATSAAPSAGAGEKTYTLETFIAFLEQEAGTASAAKMRRMIEALQ
ncbi:carbohydrate-binding module family 1 protein [Stemphylium lycopersici]|nr:carbohydrate-binding module family 1 protein [Stemphylium lycopersici]